MDALAVDTDPPGRSREALLWFVIVLFLLVAVMATAWLVAPR